MEYMKGLFFKDQHLGARGLGAFGAAALSDGILNGCEVTISNGTATIAPGHVIVGGRVCRIPTAVAVGTVGAAFSRISAEVDLEGASSKTEFTQAYLDLQRANTLAELWTSDASGDVNLSDTERSSWLWIYDAVSGKVSYNYARSPAKQRLWRNYTASGGSGVGSGFAAQTLILPGLHNFNAFEITFAINAESGASLITLPFTMPDPVFLQTNSDSSSPLNGKKFAKFDAVFPCTTSSWAFLLTERNVYIYPEADAIVFSKSYWSYPHYNSSSYRGSGTTNMIPIEIYGVHTDRRLFPGNTSDA